MKAVIQRVKNADVAVNGETVGKCGNGLMVLFGAETNDTPEDADKIARKFHAVFGSSMPLHINLIPVNSIAETDFQASSEKRIFEFQKRLQREHIVATVRRTLGADIHASCGQLRNRAERKSTENA